MATFGSDDYDMEDEWEASPGLQPGSNEWDPSPGLQLASSESKPLLLLQSESKELKPSLVLQLESKELKPSLVLQLESKELKPSPSLQPDSNTWEASPGLRSESNTAEVTSEKEVASGEQTTGISKVYERKAEVTKERFTTEVRDVNKVFKESRSELEVVCGVKSVNKVTSVYNVARTRTVTSSNEDGVRTLFVSGLPMDASARELYLLCRSYKGYMDCKLNNARNKFGKPLAPIGFVTFATRDDAGVAMAELQDVIFDPLLPNNTIRLEFAKCNSKAQNSLQSPQVKRSLPVTTPSAATAIPSANINNLNHPAAHFQRPGSSAPAGVVHDAYGNPYFPPHPAHTVTLPSTRSPYAATDQASPAFYHHEFRPQSGHPAPGLSYGDTMLRAYSSPHSPVAYFTPMSTAPMGSHPGHPPTNNNTSNSSSSNYHNGAAYQQQKQQQHPSSTLFVANLGLFVTEKELTDIFANTPGFLNVTLYKKGISPVAFIKYIDVRCAVLAMTALQGSLLKYSYSDRGGIRIEFAKAKSGGERDDNMSMCGSTTAFSDGDTNFVQNGWSPVPPSALSPWLDPVHNWSVY